MPEEDRVLLKQLDDDYLLKMHVEAESYYQVGAFAMTVKILEIYTRIYFSNPLAWNRLGTAYSEINEKLKAVACYQKAHELDNSEEDFVFNYTSSLHELGQTETAIKALSTHFKIHPEHKLYLYFQWHWYDHPMATIKEAWRKRNQRPMKVVNEDPA